MSSQQKKPPYVPFSREPHPDTDLFTHIRYALLRDEPQKVQSLLDAGANPFEQNEEGAQLLTHAAVGGNPDLVRQMLVLGCDPNHKSIRNRTPLHDAAYAGKTDAIHVLIEAGADLNCPDFRGYTPLTDAFRTRHLKAAEALIRQGADVHVRDPLEKRTPLMLAAAEGAVELTRLLLRKGSDIGARDFIGCTPLIHAARSRNPQVVKVLLDAGAIINETDKNGDDALIWALRMNSEGAVLLLERSSISPEKATAALLTAAPAGNVNIINKLLLEGAAIQPSKPGGASALNNSILARSSDAMQLLLQQPAVQVNYRAGIRLWTPLISATRKGDVEKARMLLDAGADTDMGDAYGKTAVHYAAANANVAVLKLLQHRGADILSVGLDGRGLLHRTIYDMESWAKEQARAETLKWLLDQKLNPDQPDNRGTTPLMLAAYHARTDIVHRLLEEGADVHLKDEDGRSALYHAVCCGTEYGLNDRYVKPRSRASDKAVRVITALLQTGADPNLPGIQDAAKRWRWPGVLKLMEQYGATQK